jgi:tRNA C32,U32 (ribose-2'-O)-methylase TrmJ
MNRGCEYMEDVYAKIDSLKAEQKEIMRDIRNLETRTTINEKDIATINKQLEKISTNTTWILRIIISAIVMSVLGLILKGMI